MPNTQANPPSSIQTLLASLPNDSGVYEFYDKQDILIYVGKAKNLRKRVHSYFNRQGHQNAKIETLVRKICNIRFTIVNSETDALLLENNLIKKHQPRYNVMMKDDKTYPWICIKDEPFPRVFAIRNITKSTDQLFGPYASVKMMNTLLSLITKLYKLRNCTLNLSNENIRKQKYKICLAYHIGNCLGPCEGFQLEEDYNQNISHIREILKGNLSKVNSHLKEMMNHYSEQMEFEKAHHIKEKSDLLERFQSKTTIVNPDITDVDVFFILTDNESGYVNYLKIIDGAIVQTYNVEIKKKLDETDEELLSYAILNLRERFESNTSEIILPFTVEMPLDATKITIPKQGDKKKLLELSERNVRYYRQEKYKQRELVDPDKSSKRIMEQMKKDLRMKVLPEHIECFDNSNIQGEHAVSAMVVFKKAKPAKKEYRHYNIKTVEGPNDYASMQEVVSRRYMRLLDENQPLPQLIVIDGGKGQLGEAVEILNRLNLRGKIAVIGIAKKLEEIYFPGDQFPLYIDKTSETMRVLQHIRDEAHRFGITHHRNKRSKAAIKTELTAINGIGEGIANKLLQEFISVKRIKEQLLEDLEKSVGNAKAKIVFEYFHKKNNEKL